MEIASLQAFFTCLTVTGMTCSTGGIGYTA
jgi:hypothetical protein